MIGTTLAHYRITAALGAGGMGEVWRATDTKLGREVALKVLPEEFASDPQRLDRFEREARAVAALNHPHIVTIFSVEDADGVRFLTMELVEGETLDGMIPAGGFELGRFFDFATPLAEAVSAAHDRSIIHRDLKPTNVMVDRDGRVKVMDFGLAKVASAEDPSDSSELPTEALTGIGTIVGTVPYMSPEQIEGEIVDHRTDIFSLGVLLYEMAVGERPFQGKTSPSLMSSILKDAPTPVVELRSDLPRHLGRIIGRCLEKNRRDRYQTARDVFNELKALQREASSMGAPQASASLHQEPSERNIRPSSDAAVSTMTRKDEGFWVAVLPFKYSGGDADLTALAEGLSEDIVTGLSRFSYLRVIARSSTERYVGEAVDVRSVGTELAARYVMEGSIRQAGSTLRISAQLVDTSSGAHIWAETYERPFGTDAIFELQDDLVPRIVSTVADWYGILPHSMSEAVRSKPVDQLTPYEALLRGFGYFERVTPEEHAVARPILERAVEQVPGHAAAWAMLSMLYGEEHRFGFNVEPDPLGRSLQAARRAIETAPSSHASHLALAQAHYFRKDFDAFRNAAERAVALNPMDGATVEYLGHLLAFAGDWERGCELGERARQLNPHHPAWYWALPLLDAYRKGDYLDARALVPKALMPGQYYSHALFAALYGQLGEREAAVEAIRELLALRPDFAQIARDQFEKWYLPQLVEQLIDGLGKAGLEIPPASDSDVSLAGADESPGPASGASRADEGFWIAVLPFKYRGSDPDVETLADGLADEIVSGLSRFSFLRVIASTSTAKYAGDAAEAGPVGRKLGARYVIEGHIRQAGPTLRISAQLVDTGSGAHLWAETYERPFRPEAVFELQDDLVPRIVSTVGDAHGILPHTMSELLRSKDPGQLTPYEAVLRSFGYGYRRTPEEHAAVRDALERAVEQAPRYADAWAMLALVYVDEQAHGYNRRPDPVGRALQAARRAADAAPSNALAFNALAWAMFFRKEFQAFRTAAEQSIALNPLNSPTLAGLGALTAYSGDWERGCALVERALDLNPRHPGWYWLPLFYDAYRRGDYRGAANVALKLNLPAFFVMHEALAAAYGQLGESDTAGEALREMLRLKPDYDQTGRERLEKWFDQDLVEHFVDGLRKAGFKEGASVERPRGRVGSPRHTVGRQSELDALREALESAREGRGSLVCVAGEPGIGKTTLVEGFLDDAVAKGRCTVARGRSSERIGGSDAYLPVLEALGSLLHTGDREKLARTMRHVAPAWYVQIAPPGGDSNEMDRLLEQVKETTQERLKLDFVACVQELSRSLPMVVFLDDLHWADESTVDLLSFLAAKFEGLNVLVVVTYRPSDMQLSKHAFLRIKPDLQTRGVCRELLLEFLHESEVADYLALEFPDHRFPGDFPALIHSKTEGSPLFMADLVRYLRENGAIGEDDGGWRLMHGLPEIENELPESVRGMIERKIGQLGKEDHELLIAASVQGFVFDSAIAAEILGMPPEEVEERLEHLERVHAFVELTGETELPDRTVTLRYRFVHVLYQNALYGSLKPTRKARLSFEVGEALERAHGKKIRGVAHELAALFEAGRDFARAAEHYLTAAGQAIVDLCPSGSGHPGTSRASRWSGCSTRRRSAPAPNSSCSWLSVWHCVRFAVSGIPIRAKCTSGRANSVTKSAMHRSSFRFCSGSGSSSRIRATWRRRWMLPNRCSRWRRAATTTASV